MIILKEYEYARIENPVIRDSEGELQYTSYGEVKLREGMQEIRPYYDYEDPFPLYPGERLKQVAKFTIVPRNSALR